MPESAKLKTAKSKSVNLKTAKPSSATKQVPSSAIASTADSTLLAGPVKTTLKESRPFSTGSPLLDSFVSSSAEKTVYIPNPHIMGHRLGARQGPSFRNVSLDGPTTQLSRTRFDGEDFKRAGIASAAVPVKKSSKAIQLKSQPPQSSSEQQKTAKKPRQPNQQAATTAPRADTQSAAQREQPSQVKNNKPLPNQAKGQRLVEKLGQKPRQSATPKSEEKSAGTKSAGTKSAGPKSAGTKSVGTKSADKTSEKRQRSQPGTTRPPGSPPVSRQNGSRSTAAPINLAAAPGPRVYGGSDYKALQSRAAAGGLVDLEDTLLFGGAEDKSSPLSIGNAPPGAENNSMAVLEYLLTLPSDFVLTKPEGNRAILDDFSWLERPAFIPTQAVIDAKNFEVVEQTSPQTQAVQPQNEQATAGDAAELKELTQKIDQLHQRIEYLSERLASLDAAPSAAAPSAAAPETVVINHAEIFDAADIDPLKPTAFNLF